MKKLALILIVLVGPAFAATVAGYAAKICHNGSHGVATAGIGIEGLIKVSDPRFRTSFLKEITDPDSIHAVVSTLGGQPVNIGNRLDKIFKVRTDLRSYIEANRRANYKEYLKFVEKTVRDQVTGLRSLADQANVEIRRTQVAAEDEPNGEKRRELQNRARKLVNLRMFLNETANGMEIGKEEQGLLDAQKDGPLNTRTFAKDFPRLSQLVTGLQGREGELQVGTRVPDPIWLGLKVGLKKPDDPPDHIDKLVSQIREKLPSLTEGEARAMLRREIDVEFKDGKAWAEVKNSGYVMDVPFITGKRWESDYQSVLEQASRTANLARLLGKEYHLYFVNGVTADAVALLQEKGAIVHATIISEADIQK